MKKSLFNSSSDLGLDILCYCNLIEQIKEYNIELVQTDNSDNELVYSIYSDEEDKPLTKITYTYVNTEQGKYQIQTMQF